MQELSPYSALLTGPTTVASLFGHMSGRQKGMLMMIWDVVGFDEVADLEKMPKVITTPKTYCESGQFQRGQEAMAGYASIAMFGNTNQPIDVMVQTGHLFALPDVVRDDMAFIDRLHCYRAGRCRRCATSASPTTTASSWTTWPRRSASSASSTSRR